MSGRIIKRGRHTHLSCLPGGYGNHGDKWECECGRRWKFDGYINRWQQTWPSMVGLRPHRRAEA